MGNGCARGTATGVVLAGLVAFASWIGGSGVARADYIALNTSPGSPGDNVTDPLWRVTYDAGVVTVDSATKSVQGAGFPFPPWIADTNASDWVIPDAYTRNNAPPAGGAPIDFTYYVKFDLTQDQISTASLAGRWASDNDTFSITLNGHAIAPGANSLATSYRDWTALTGTGAGYFQLSNTLEFHVYNQPQASSNPSGFRFEGGVTTVPEPASLVMSAAGVLALGGLSWKRRLARRAA